MRATVGLIVCSMMSASLPTLAACDLEPERAIVGSPLSFWTAEFRSRDRERAAAARSALRAHPVDALAAILAAKSAVENAKASRGRYGDLKELFEGATPATSLLVAYLDCDRPRVREMAIQLLGWIGPAARDAQPVVVAALADQDGDVRMQAGFTVARIGVVDDAVLAALRRTLDDTNWRAANAAATALAGFWPRSRETFAKALRGEPARERFWAMRGLKHVKELEPALVALLVERAERDSPDNRNEALERLRALDPARVAPHLQRLEPLLADQVVRCQTARLLAGRAGPELDPVLIATFVDLMQGPQSPRRDGCHEKVHKDVPRIGASTVEPLAALLRHAESHVRTNALHAISLIEPRPAAVYRHFVSVLDDPELREKVGYKLQASGVSAVPTLRMMLQHDSPAVRDIAAQAARRIGEPARPLVPLLVERLPGETGSTRSSFISALGFIGGEDATAAIPELERAASDPATHAVAISALARISGPAAVDLARELVVALGEQSKGMCPHPTADDDLRGIGLAAVPAVVEALADDSSPRLILLQLLDEWGDPALTAAVPILERWIEQASPFSLDAAERLQRLGLLDAAIAETIFEKALASFNDWRRLRGAEGLARLGGPSCARGRQALTELREHRYEKLRERAVAALEQPCR